MVTKYWGPRPRRLTVSFMDATPADLRRRIVSHMNAWTRTGSVTFVETQGSGQVRVSRGGGGYWSYLGTDIRLIPTNRPTMNLQGFTMDTAESEFRRVIRHEAGHNPHDGGSLARPDALQGGNCRGGLIACHAFLVRRGARGRMRDATQTDDVPRGKL